MSYRQLTEGQRYQISLLISQKFSLREIAKQMGVAPSTISRELRRNSIKSGLYEPDLAYQQAPLWQDSWHYLKINQLGR